MSDAQRWLVPANSADANGIRLALGLAIKLCEEKFRGVREISLLVPVKDNLKGTTLESALTEGICKALLKGESVPITREISLKLYTQRTFKQFSADLILCIYADDKLLDIVDGLTELKGCVVVPWVTKNIQKWTKTWNPRILGKKEQEAPQVISDPMVIAALESLTDRVNLSTGLSHPSDKEAADQMLRILKKNKYDFDPENVRAWAVKNGWSPRGADQLEKLAAKISKLKRVVINKRLVWSENILEVWGKMVKN